MATGRTVVIWHNPRCTKSRETLALLRERGVKPVVREYLKEPPSKQEVETLLDQLGVEPRTLVRDGEAAFKASGRKAATLTRQDAVELIARHPILLQRPVVVSGGKAAIGRPPEAALSILPK
ncbi:MAG: arsenate reductase (glutaredoxin) [Alphaproteobacteria bacterium]|nr:arsenate reductase (glutaredoxin) [Alphaproteobacteria bacterium]MCW5740500.1 arsenate reductase (glutaredoxin) [Alphaproteobacteria bacterium]